VLDGGTAERPGLAGVPGATAAGHPFLVMELVDGPTLAAALREGPLDPGRAAAVGVQLAGALAYVHAYDVVHRDVKPGNVLLGSDGRVKLADFGIARLIGDTVRHTRTGTAIGTAAYLSPEQVEGAEVTTATDVWSLGLVLLEALTGRQAYPGTPTEAALARLSRAPEVPADLPGPWRSVLDGALRRDPALRPTAAEVAHALRSTGTGPLPVAESAPPDAHATRVLPVVAAERRGRRAVASVREHPAPVVVGVLLALLIAVAGLVGGVEGEGGGREPVGEVPAEVPPQLEPLLRDLHDAVEEGAR
jgi:serine/threonine protein kinase